MMTIMIFFDHRIPPLRSWSLGEQISKKQNYMRVGRGKNRMYTQSRGSFFIEIAYQPVSIIFLTIWEENSLFFFKEDYNASRLRHVFSIRLFSHADRRWIINIMGNVVCAQKTTTKCKHLAKLNYLLMTNRDKRLNILSLTFCGFFE